MRRAIRVVIAGVVALAVVTLALAAGYPQLRQWWDASDLEPGLLQVDPVARGSVSLGNGVYAQIGSGGLTVSRRNREVWRGVDRGSPVTAGIGRLAWRGASDGGASGGEGVLRADEQVEHSLGNVRITGRTLERSRVTYTGRVFDGSYDGPDSLPLTLALTRREGDSRILLDVQVPGADAVALHEYRPDGYTYRGLGAQSAANALQQGRYPIVTRAQGIGRGQWPLTLWQDVVRGGSGGDAATTPAPVPAYLSSARSGLALDTTRYAVVDLRHPGRVDTTVWDDAIHARLYDGRPEQMLAQHSSDIGTATPPPGWSSSGAVVGVRGSVAHVREVVGTLQRAHAAVAAVLVRDGGARRRYPGWADLVAGLRGRGVRVMTTVSAGLALAPRAGGSDDEPALLARARAQGWLVTDDSGRPMTVALADVDRGTVPGALVDLTDPEAVGWYTGVLARRMRADGLAGWYAQGGHQLPMDARLAHGDPAVEHNAWPRRWASLTRTACSRAGVADCLLLQDSADERTGQLIGVLGLGHQTSDWSPQDGLGAVLPATLNAGASGLPLVHSGVGGWSSPSVPLWPDAGRSDELLARWTELEVFGPLLRTEDGLHPGAVPQVWDSPHRLAAFARATRLFAAMADYRRSAIADAATSGIPVVRSAWLGHPDLGLAAGVDELFFGDSLLVAPVLEEGVRSIKLGLPPGTWVELFSGRRHEVPEPPPTPPGSSNTPVAARPIEVAAPLGRPVVLYRSDDRDAVQLADAMRAAGLLG